MGSSKARQARRMAHQRAVLAGKALGLAAGRAVLAAERDLLAEARDAAGLARDMLLLAELGDETAMAGLADEFADRPELLGGALVVVAQECARAEQRFREPGAG